MPTRITSKTIPAGELRAGMQVAERDGYLLDIREVVSETPKTITLRVGSDFSISMRGDVTVRLRKSSKVRVPFEVVEEHPVPSDAELEAAGA